MIGTMTSLQMGLRPWVIPAGGPDADTWITRSVESTIEFSLDGRSVSELARADDHMETVTIFDLDDKMLAAEVLLGRAVLSDGFPAPGRSLICSRPTFVLSAHPTHGDQHRLGKELHHERRD